MLEQLPSPEVLAKIAAAVDDHWLACPAGREAMGWDKLALLLRDQSDSSGCAGVLAVPVVDDGQLLFFRPELRCCVPPGLVVARARVRV